MGTLTQHSLAWTCDDCTVSHFLATRILRMKTLAHHMSRMNMCWLLVNEREYCMELNKGSGRLAGSSLPETNSNSLTWTCDDCTFSHLLATRILHMKTLAHHMSRMNMRWLLVNDREYCTKIKGSNLKKKTYCLRTICWLLVNVMCINMCKQESIIHSWKITVVICLYH